MCVASSCSQHPWGQSPCVFGSILLMKWLSLLCPLRRRNSAVWILLFLLLFQGKKPKPFLLTTAIFFDWANNLLNVMDRWFNFVLAITCLMSTMFVIVFVQVLRWTFLMNVANWSVISLPRIPACEGIDVSVIMVPADLRFLICCIISGITVLESYLKLVIAWIDDLESVKMVAASTS
jgi:hypothetical protein